MFREGRFDKLASGLQILRTTLHHASNLIVILKAVWGNNNSELNSSVLGLSSFGNKYSIWHYNNRNWGKLRKSERRPFLRTYPNANKTIKLRPTFVKKTDKPSPICSASKASWDEHEGLDIINMTNVNGTCDCYHLIDVLISGHIETAVLLGSYLANIFKFLTSDSSVHHQ